MKVCLPSKYVNINDLMIEHFSNKKMYSYFSSKMGTITLTKVICFQDSRFIKLFFIHLKSGQVLEYDSITSKLSEAY